MSNHINQGRTEREVEALARELLAHASVATDQPWTAASALIAAGVAILVRDFGLSQAELLAAELISEGATACRRAVAN